MADRPEPLSPVLGRGGRKILINMKTEDNWASRAAEAGEGNHSIPVFRGQLDDSAYSRASLSAEVIYSELCGPAEGE